MFSSKRIVVALWLAAVLASSSLLSPRREVCAERVLSDSRGSDEDVWYYGCNSCAGANLNNGYVDGSCGGCTGAVQGTYCMICTDYEVTTTAVSDGPYEIPPGYLGEGPAACNDGLTLNMATYKCNRGECSGFATVIGRCLNTVEFYGQEPSGE